jgi:BASS family bile acid:Na+ symporter
MKRLAAWMNFAGRHGPALLFAGVLLGLAWPGLAAAARPVMGVAVFVFTLGAFLKVDAAALRAEMARARFAVAVLGWVAVGVPAVSVAVAAGLPPSLGAGLVLCMLAPPVGSAAAIAAMLGLRPALALVATVAITLASPFYLPQAADWLGGVGLHIDPLSMTLRLGLIVGAAAGAAVLLRRFAARSVERHPQAMTGVAVLGLLVVGVGAMHGMQDHFAHDMRHVLEVLAVAFAVNAGFQLMGALLFARCARVDALTVGLISGNRNVTLVWAAAAPALALQPDVELFVAMSVFPIFMLPLVMRRLLMRVPRKLWLTPKTAAE